MKKILDLKRKDGEMIKGEIRELDSSYIEKIMEIQEVILNGLEDKQLYAPTEREEFLEYFNMCGKLIGCLTKEDGLVAMGVYVKKGFEEGNYGYDLDIEGDDLLKVGQIESTIVREDYRGNKLQKIMCEMLEEIGGEDGTTIMTATASPFNEFSVNTFKNLGYKICKEKIKYGGYKRYVLMKEL